MDAVQGAARLPVAPALADVTGSLRTGVVATLVDLVSGGVVGRAVAPHWMATADLSVHMVAAVPVGGGGTLRATGSLLRAGRTTAVIEVELTHAHAVVGIATTTFAVLPRRSTNPTIDGVAGNVGDGFGGSDGFDRPLLDAIGLQPVASDPRAVEVAFDPYVGNTLDAVQGGVVAMVLEAGAVAGLGSAVPMRVVQLEVNYLALLKVGPIRTATRVLRDTPERAVVEVRAVDHGNGDRVTTVARAVLVPGDPT